MAVAFTPTSDAGQPRKPTHAAVSGSRSDSSRASRSGDVGSCSITARPFSRCQPLPAARLEPTPALRPCAITGWQQPDCPPAYSASEKCIINHNPSCAGAGTSLRRARAIVDFCSARLLPAESGPPLAQPSAARPGDIVTLVTRLRRSSLRLAAASKRATVSTLFSTDTHGRGVWSHLRIAHFKAGQT